MSVNIQVVFPQSSNGIFSVRSSLLNVSSSERSHF